MIFSHFSLRAEFDDERRFAREGEDDFQYRGGRADAPRHRLGGTALRHEPGGVMRGCAEDLAPPGDHGLFERVGVRPR